MHRFIKLKTLVRLAGAVVVLAVLLFLGSCASIERMMAPQGEPAAGVEEPRAAAAVPPEKPERLPRFENQYTREELIKALVQFQEFSALADTLPRYMWGDRVFEDHLATIAWLENGPYKQGVGVTLRIYDQDGAEHARLTRGLSEGIPGRGRWWTFTYSGEKADFTCEYLSGLNGVPRKILLKNNASGETMARDPFFMEILGPEEGPQLDPEGKSVETGSSQAPDWFDQLRREEYQASLTPVYAGMQILGEEAVLIQGKWLRAVHLRSGSGSGALHAWLSPDVPGKLLRIQRSDDHIIAELTERHTDYERTLQHVNK